MPHARTALALTALGTLVLTGCSESGSADNGAAVRSGDADACPGEVVDVAVSVGQWGDLVEQLGGDCATVTTVVASVRRRPARLRARAPPTSPRSRTPTWSCSTAPATTPGPRRPSRTLDPAPAVVDVAEVAGARETATDPHLWYEPDVLPDSPTP